MTPEFSGLDATCLRDRQLLEGTQAGVLAPHGRDASVLLLFRFDRILGAGHPARTWLRDLGCTTALDQEEQATERAPSTQIRTVHLTWSGYRRLDAARHGPGETAFRQGMARRRRRLDDPADLAPWSFADLAILLADDDQEALEEAAESLRETVSADLDGVRLLGCLSGGASRRSGQPTDRFGFADGISQPLFLRRHIERYLERYPDADYDPSANPSLVLLPHRPAGGHGSFFVLRQLAQDVALFDGSISAAAKQTGQAPDRIEASVVGRSKDGTPHGGPPLDGFSYTGPKAGCPVHAHTLRMNPRHPDPDSRSRRIARRGFTYSSDDEEGLVFCCWQRDIVRQFEFLQRTWADAHPGDPHVDALIGRGPRRFDVGGTSVGLPLAIHLRGGAYLHTPSPHFLGGL